MKYLVMKLEVCWGLEDTDFHNAIQSALDDLRGQGAARAVGYEILDNDEEYEEWYNSNRRIQEIPIPVTTMVSWD